jgi:small subunit ribosomal protein S16
MAVKIRLQRHGKKHNAFFHIVAADGRAPRDGKFIEKLGTYNPTKNPALIDFDFDRALDWVAKGAVPTETCRAILRYKGILMRHHLNGGVTKGALTKEQADAKFEKWVNEKTSKIESKKSGLSSKTINERKTRLAGETAAKEARAAKIAAKTAPAPVETEAAPAEGGDSAEA